jgi:tetratricopeptide (TPR) repeat protein
MPENLILKNGILAYNEKRYPEAMKYFKKLHAENESAKDPEGVRDRNQSVWFLGLTYTRMGDLSNAVEQFRKLIKVKLDSATAVRLRMILGYIYAIKEQFGLARDIFLSTLKVDPDHVQALASLGFVYYRMKENKKAVKVLKQALKLDGNNPNALNSLGFIYAQTGEKLQDAVKECEKALKLKPDYAAYQDSLGVAYLKSGRLTEAKRLLSAALDRLPENTEVREHFRELVLKEMTSKKKDKTD